MNSHPKEDLTCELKEFLIINQEKLFIFCSTVILLQIVMVSPGTHLVKDHESQSGTNASQFKKKKNPKLGFYVTGQLI